MDDDVKQDESTEPVKKTRYSSLSGNELYCAKMLGYDLGDLIIGNAIFAMGAIGSFRSDVRTFVGGEIVTMTNMIAEGRRLSFEKFMQELTEKTGHGATGVSNEIIFHPGNAEFLSIGSCIHSAVPNNIPSFTTSSDAQELFCQWDAGYQPVKFVFGNVAYSIGFGMSALGSLRKLARGEVKQYTEIFNTTRNLALSRIIDEAKEAGANSIVGIRTSIRPLAVNGVQEMIMVGSSSYNSQIKGVVDVVGGITTSELTAQETWSIAKIGYAPLKLLIGTSVYSLGVVGGIRAALRNLVKGEIKVMTELVYGAREESLKKIEAQAEEIGADDVLGIKTFIYDLGGGLIEFLAIGTAVKKVPGICTRLDQLPPQAIIKQRDTFVNTASNTYGLNLESEGIKKLSSLKN